MGHLNRRSAFTLVELLVVIGIIGLLTGILLPALSKARGHAQEVQCSSNLRQVGFGIMIYADANHGQLPIDGPDGSDTGSNLIGPTNGYSGIDDPALWYNGALRAATGKSYYDLITADRLGKDTLPQAGQNKFLICPTMTGPASLSAKDVISPDGHYFMLNCVDPATGPGNTTRKFLTSYAYNSQLLSKTITTFKYSQLRAGQDVALIIEKLGNFGEYRDPEVQKYAKQYPATVGKNITTLGYTNQLGQAKANWKRFAARHRHGGNILFADGHASWLSWRDAQGNNPGDALADVGAPGRVVWNPRAPTPW